MDPNLTSPSSLGSQEALIPPTSSPHDQSPSLQSTSLAKVNDLSNDLRQLPPVIDLGVSNINRLKDTSLQASILGEIIRQLGLAGQLRTDSGAMSIMPPNIPLVDNAAYRHNFPAGSGAPSNNLCAPSPVEAVPIKSEPKYNSGSEYFPSHSSASSRSSSPEERRETFKKKLLSKQQRSPKSKKKWLTGTDSTSSRNGERLIKAQREKIKIKILDQEDEQSEKDWESPKIEDSLDIDMNSTGSMHADNVLPKWLRRDMDVLRRALLAGIEKNVEKILTSYLRSKGPIQIDEMHGNSQEDNGLGNAGSRVRLRTTGNEVTVCREPDLRPIVREHFKSLLFPNDDASRVSVPWKNLGIWLYSREKRFTNWDKVIPTDFTVRGPVYYCLKKEQHRKMMLVDLEDWTEDEKKEPWNPEIPLVIDPQNRVLIKVGDLCEMYPSQFINATTTGSKQRPGNVGPAVITMAGMSYSYTTTPRSQMKGKGLVTSSSRCDSEFDYQ